jgi:hypothetical protein
VNHALKRNHGSESWKEVEIIKIIFSDSVKKSIFGTEELII